MSQKTFDLLSNAIQAVLADGDIKKNEIGEPCIFHIVPADLDCSGRLGRHVMPVQRDMDVRRDMVRESERPMVIGWRETP
ncbi:MAG: hypothetical protein MK098_11510 [Marinovum sp.]|nr:hypothetical protein [Marinovum sp.]